MARLEHIHHVFFGATVGSEGELQWEEELKKPIEGLPQIFWKDCTGWDEANVWSVEKADTPNIKIETVDRSMKHLVKYASWLEKKELDWRHFPIKKSAQVLTRFRKHLLDELKLGSFAASSAAACMRSCIQFYRWANTHDLVGVRHPLWVDQAVVVSYFDATGFKRSVVRLSTDLRIPNAKRVGVRLEDGLLPLRAEHMNQLLSYTVEHEAEELHLLLSIGFFTGARVGTVTTLTVQSIHTAREDPMTPGLYLLTVGPGTGISTKFDVQGSLLVPSALLEDLKRYATSSSRLLREAKALPSHKGALFLTRYGKPYAVSTAVRLTHKMRQRAVRAGLHFMRRFHFHQCRATFGTWLLELLFECGLSTADAIGFLRDAMLHKDESTSITYVRFRENSRGKQKVAAAYNAAFTGLQDRNWNSANA